MNNDEKKELVADMIYMSDLIMGSSDDNLWDYCLGLAENILNRLDDEHPIWEQQVVMLVNIRIRKDAPNHPMGLAVGLVQRIKIVRQLGVMFPPEFLKYDDGMILNLIDAKKFVEEHWK